MDVNKAHFRKVCRKAEARRRYWIFVTSVMARYKQMVIDDVYRKSPIMEALKR